MAAEGTAPNQSCNELAGAQRDVATDVRSLLTQKFEQELQGLVELAHRVQSSLGKLDGLAADYDAQIGREEQEARARSSSMEGVLTDFTAAAGELRGQGVRG